MLRLLLIAVCCVPFCLFTSVQIAAEEEAAESAAADSDIISAARQANVFYQNRRDTLLRDLAGTDDKAKVKALRDLSDLREEALIPVVAPYIDFNLHNEPVVKAACLALARLNAQDYVDELTNITKQPNSSEAEKRAAWNAISLLKALTEVHFEDQSVHFDTAIRASGVTNYGTRQIADAGKILAHAVVKDRRVHIRRMAAIGLGRIADDNHAEALISALTDGDIQVRRYASNALVILDHKPAIPYLLIQLESNVGGKYLNQALIALSGEDFGYDHTGTLNERRQAIARGFRWYTENSKDF